MRVPHCCRTPPGCTPDAPAPTPARSNTRARMPRSRSCHATDRPITPAPTTATSTGLATQQGQHAVAEERYAAGRRQALGLAEIDSLRTRLEHAPRLLGDLPGRAGEDEAVERRLLRRPELEGRVEVCDDVEIHRDLRPRAL